MNPADVCFVTHDLSALVDRGARFGCVYADPPWRFDRSPRGAAARHYATMSLDELLALPVSDLVADDAHTHSFLWEARRVLEAWGFEYRSLFTWVKPRLGTGYYWRAAAEYLLLGVRGRCRFRDRSIRNWVVADRTTHSTKPEVVRDYITRVSPGAYLELFARKATPGWTAFGDQIEPSLFGIAIDGRGRELPCQTKG